MILREVCLDALRLIGVIEVGHGASSDEDTEQLRVVNSMLDAARTERLLAYSILSTAYTVSGSGTITVPKPVRIEGLWIVNGDSHTPLDVNGNQFRYLGGIFNDGAYPTSTITLTPALAAGTQVLLETWLPLAAFAAITDTVAMPPGYLEWMQYNLAIRLAPRYKDSNISQLVYDMARESKANVKRMNAQVPILQIDRALLNGGGGFNILTGDYR